MTHVPPGRAFAMAKVIEPLPGDVLITDDEIKGLMAHRLISQQEPNGHTRLYDWLRQNAQNLGRSYASELQRHYR
jgi:NADH dehydrogenase